MFNDSVASSILVLLTSAGIGCLPTDRDTGKYKIVVILSIALFCPGREAVRHTGIGTHSSTVCHVQDRNCERLFCSELMRLIAFLFPFVLSLPGVILSRSGRHLNLHRVVSGDQRNAQSEYNQ